MRSPTTVYHFSAKPTVTLALELLFEQNTARLMLEQLGSGEQSGSLLLVGLTVIVLLTVTVPPTVLLTISPLNRFSTSRTIESSLHIVKTI